MSIFGLAPGLSQTGPNHNPALWTVYSHLTFVWNLKYMHIQIVIGNLTWLPGIYLEEWHPIDNSRMPWHIFSKFSTIFHTCARYIGIAFGHDRKSNMAARRISATTSSRYNLPNFWGHTSSPCNVWWVSHSTQEMLTPGAPDLTFFWRFTLLHGFDVFNWFCLCSLDFMLRWLSWL